MEAGVSVAALALQVCAGLSCRHAILPPLLTQHLHPSRPPRPPALASCLGCGKGDTQLAVLISAAILQGGQPLSTLEPYRITPTCTRTCMSARTCTHGWGMEELAAC